MKIHRFRELPSTNDHLSRLAGEGAPEWTVVTADHQTEGRGRRTRDWWSPRGNLHMSVLIRPETGHWSPARLPIIAALAFLCSLPEVEDHLTVKWPNDVLLDGRKVAGILIQSRSENTRPLWAVAGFGANLRLPREAVPAGLEGRIGFLHEHLPGLTPDDLVRRIVDGLQKWYPALGDEGWPAARAAWTGRARLGVPYTHRGPGGQIRGTPSGIDEYGGLIMETERGPVTIYSGEIEEAE